MNIAIQTAGALRKVEIFRQAREAYDPLPKGATREINRDKWGKILSALGKIAKKDAARQYPGKTETAARADLTPQLLVNLIRQSALLDNAGKRWVLDLLVWRHSRFKGKAVRDA